MKYSIDASSLLHLRHFRPEIHVSLWNKINELIESKNLFSTMEVLPELKKGDNGVRKKWEKIHNDNGKDFFRNPKKNEVRIAKNIINNYRDFIRPKYYSETGIWADPYVIALAKEKNGIVISEETAKKGNNIPYVCYKLGIKCMNLDEFMLHNKWEF